MTTDPQRPVVLTKVQTESEAGMIIAQLDRAGIEAESAGALTSGLLGENLGEVEILVHESDLERAREVLSEDGDD
jgi:hypothetical protein